MKASPESYFSMDMDVKGEVMVLACFALIEYNEKKNDEECFYAVVVKGQAGA